MNTSIHLPHLFFLLLILTTFSCQQPVGSSIKTIVDEETSSNFFHHTTSKLSPYWQQGKAELNVYDIQQNRYQGTHPGQALLIFVSEDFLTDHHVKNDHYKNPNSTPVLKLNAITRFTTGLYDYSIMSSIFTPVRTQDFSHTLKVTNSIQDWCGQTFSQLNKQNNSYELQRRSYFESEGDEEQTIPANILEDEIVNRIRMGWQHLPIGPISIIPSLSFTNLKHLPLKAYQAIASQRAYTGADFSGNNLQQYTLHYPSINRQLIFVFEHAAPYHIVGWTDAYPSAFDGQVRRTIATLKTTALEDYWTQNTNTPEYLQKRTRIGWH